MTVSIAAAKMRRNVFCVFDVRMLQSHHMTRGTASDAFCF